jgi:hypothetical protein
VAAGLTRVELAISALTTRRTLHLSCNPSASPARAYPWHEALCASLGGAAGPLGFEPRAKVLETLMLAVDTTDPGGPPHALLPFGPDAHDRHKYGQRDSNPRRWNQNPGSYHWTMPAWLGDQDSNLD